jgi:hypothetical protein
MPGHYKLAIRALKILTNFGEENTPAQLVRSQAVRSAPVDALSLRDNEKKMRKGDRPTRIVRTISL